MKRNIISSLSSLIGECGNKETIDVVEKIVIDSFDEFVKEDALYELPTNEILKIIGKSEIGDLELLCEVVSRMCKSKGEESTLLLNVIDQKEATLEECIEIISKFVNCPLCRRLGKSFKESMNLTEKEIEIPLDLDRNIYNAAREGKLANIRYLVEHYQANVEEKDSFGRTPLDIASFNGHLKVVKYLYEKCHANVETKSNGGFTPISNASRNGKLDVVKYLYETCHANVEAKDKVGRTPINNASLNGHLVVVNYLYETCHADVELKENYGHAPISNASRNGHLEIVKYLYERCHADVETKNIYGHTPLYIAARNDHLDIVKYLYETCHADVSYKTINDAKQECKDFLTSKYSLCMQSEIIIKTEAKLLEYDTSGEKTVQIGFGELQINKVTDIFRIIMKDQKSDAILLNERIQETMNPTIFEHKDYIFSICVPINKKKKDTKKCLIFVDNKTTRDNIVEKMKQIIYSEQKSFCWCRKW